ncbi:Hypothetical_protein [Hexamita inflata]|uniref:Hypothetical_protein n=1 Tax=Hexamita inflata TaxID=28002 RepID=A0AA86UM70_9EUKA|nr:Hypothetical protein HINF_LOCUS48539 [Hexamita inflata]
MAWCFPNYLVSKRLQMKLTQSMNSITVLVQFVNFTQTFDLNPTSFCGRHTKLFNPLVGTYGGGGWAFGHCADSQVGRFGFSEGWSGTLCCCSYDIVTFL